MYNVVSFGIMNEEDIDLLIKQKNMFEKYCEEEINFIVVPGREQFQPHNKNYINLISKLESLDLFQVYMPKVLKNDSNINKNMSIFVGMMMEECFRELKLGKYFYTHLDNFPIKKFSLKNLFGDHLIAGHKQTRGHVYYLWDNCLFIDTENIKQDVKFGCGVVDGQACDTGGLSYHYLKSLNNDECKYFTECLFLNDLESIKKLEVEESIKQCLIKNFYIQLEEKNKYGDPHWSELHLNETFFHYRSFSGWHRKDPETLKIKQLRKNVILDA